MAAEEQVDTPEVQVQEEEPGIGPSLPDQHDFYRMPAKFGHIPVAEEPLGWDPKHRFEHLYPHVRLPSQVVERYEFGSPGLEPNKLFFGDNLHVMRQLPNESIDLIYIDPPFFSQQNYNVLFGDQNELRSFRDIWEGGLNGYLVWLNARLYEMKRLLKPTGSLVVHLDWHASHYAKVELDRLFGYEHFQNEIVWFYRGGGVSKRRFGRKHDILLWYSRGKEWKFVGDAVRVPYSEDSLERLKYKARSFRGDRVYDKYEPHVGGKPARGCLGDPTSDAEQQEANRLSNAEARGALGTRCERPQRPRRRGR